MATTERECTTRKQIQQPYSEHSKNLKGFMECMKKTKKLELVHTVYQEHSKLKWFHRVHLEQSKVETSSWSELGTQ